MTRSVYVIGGAGVGKSTFMAALLDRLGVAELGPLAGLYASPNARGTVVTLRGHPFRNGGMYLGVMRDQFPGTDGLDRASSMVGRLWLLDAPELPQVIVGEGSTLATRPFLSALAARTELLLIHLVCDEEVQHAQLAGRGSAFDPGFVKMTITRSANLARDIAAPVLTAGPDDLELVLDLAALHLEA